VNARFPDFFVVGAPRCGTTSLCKYLSRNPQVCFSQPKEPHYFTWLDHEPSPAELRRDYLDRYFPHCEDAHCAVGEGSVSYLYVPEAIERIRRLNPEARFIAMVRNPLQMLPSYHLKMLYLLQEDAADFGAAWARMPERARGVGVPKFCLDPRLLIYSEVGKLGEQVQRLYDVAGRERSHVVVFDDLASDPLGVYRRVLEFLGVEYDGQTHFERKYASRTYRHRWLQQLLYVPAVRGGKVVDSLQRRTRKYKADGTRRKSWLKRLASWNKIPASPAPLTAEMRAVVGDALRPDVEHLSKLLDRDLRHWLTART
jgi:hypothetical protein